MIYLSCTKMKPRKIYARPKKDLSPETPQTPFLVHDPAYRRSNIRRSRRRNILTSGVRPPGGGPAFHQRSFEDVLYDGLDVANTGNVKLISLSSILFLFTNLCFLFLGLVISWASRSSLHFVYYWCLPSEMRGDVRRRVPYL